MVTEVQMLEAKILHFYTTKLSGEIKKQYAEYFGIISSREGIIKKESNDRY